MANMYLPPVNTVPNSLIITAITKANPMVVTATLVNTGPNPRVNTYQVGQNVRLFVPKSYGMYQANGLVGTITAISGETFTLNLDSSLFDTFSVPPSSAETPASISPSGSKNLEYNNSNVNAVPFHNLNNIGN